MKIFRGLRAFVCILWAETWPAIRRDFFPPFSTREDWRIWWKELPAHLGAIGAFAWRLAKLSTVVLVVIVSVMLLVGILSPYWPFIVAPVFALASGVSALFAWLGLEGRLILYIAVLYWFFTNAVSLITGEECRALHYRLDRIERRLEEAHNSEARDLI